MSWASRRRTFYTSIIILGLTVIIGIPLFFLLYEEPTCFDNKENQDEVGIDCGGVCELLCQSQVIQPTILWSRAVAVTDGVYNAVAYVENPNFDIGTNAIVYLFKLFDEDNILIAERKGVTFIAPNSILSVFEGGIITGERVPKRTFFEFKGSPKWFKMHNPAISLIVENSVLSGAETLPKIEAEIRNSSTQDISDIEIIVIVFDENGNAIAASKTSVDRLRRLTSSDIVFTWPKPFSVKVGKIEIIMLTPPLKQ